MPTNQNVYFFGNSLVNYAEGGPETNAPIWMNRFAGFEGNSFATEGGYGFLRNFADADTPNTDWGFNGVAEVYDADTTSFAEANFDSIVITPANFLQDRPATADYYDEPRAPLDAMIDIVNAMSADQPDARIFIYEGWADMGPFAPSDTPTSSQLAAYHAYNTGDYHDWYVDLADQTEAATGAEVTLIPVASVLSELLSTQPLSEIPFEDLYTDTAPHGTETLYFLAGLTTYGALYGSLPAADYPVSANIHPDVAIYYNDIAQNVADLLGTYGFDVRVSNPYDAAPVFDDLDLADAVTVGITDDSTAQDEAYPSDGYDDDTGTFTAQTRPSTIQQQQQPTDFPDTPTGTLLSQDGTSPSFTRTLTADQDGPYSFQLAADDLAILHIDGTPVLMNDGTDPTTPQSITLDLAAGDHQIDVYYYEDQGGEYLTLDMGPATPNTAFDTGLPLTDFDDIPEDDDDTLF